MLYLYGKAARRSPVSTLFQALLLYMHSEMADRDTNAVSPLQAGSNMSGMRGRPPGRRRGRARLNRPGRPAVGPKPAGLQPRRGVGRPRRDASLSNVFHNVDGSEMEEGSMPVPRGTHKAELDIGLEMDRWQELMERQDVDSHEELAKMLLDSWELKETGKELVGIQVTAATFRDFETYKTRCRRTPDDLVRFFLRLDAEPGQTVIVLNEEMGKLFEAVKHGLKTNQNNCMKHLLHVRDKYLEMKGKPVGIKNVEPSVRMAVREEMMKLAQDGVFTPPTPTCLCSCSPSSSTSTPDKQSGQTEKPSVSPDFPKKRPRKSLPQRVIAYENNTGMSEDSEQEIEMVSDPVQTSVANGHQVLNDASAEPPLPAFNYIMSEAIPVNGQPMSTAGLTSTPTTFVQLVGSPQVLTPAAANAIFLQQASNMAPKIAPKPSPSGANENSQTYRLPGGAMVVQNENGKFKCPDCDFQGASFISLRSHFIHHPVKAYKCNLCERSYLEEYKLREHFEIKHEHSIHFLCEVCNKEFTSKGGLKYHLKRLHKNDFKFFCEECCKGFNSEQHYNSHIEKHSRSHQYKCSQCNKEFSTFTTFTNHRKICVRLSTEDDSLVCDLCGDDFTTEADLTEHISSEHCDVSRFRCICGEEFRWRRVFDEHKRMCNYAVERKTVMLQPAVDDSSTEDGLSNLAIINVESLMEKDELNKGTCVDMDEDSTDAIQITNVESGEQFNMDIKPEPQPMLLQSFQTLGSSKLRLHNCKFCDYRTPKLSHMKRHELTHLRSPAKAKVTKIAPKPVDIAPSKPKSQGYYHARYKCDKCTRTFSSKGGISYHQQTKHNNAYKYKCETCDKGFNTYQHYVGHKNTHTGVRPFVCNSCGVGFSYPSVLTSHRKVCKGKVEGLDKNGGLDYYPCKLCKEKFALPSSLQDHISESHSDTITSKYVCVCSEEFQLRALYDLHRTTCTKTDISSTMIIQAIQNEINPSADKVDDRTDFSELSPEMFNATLNNQPVFPS